MDLNKLENIELKLLLEAIYDRYGYDFRNYAKASLLRRTRLFMDKAGMKRIADLIPAVLHEENVFLSLVHHYSITVTEFFRDPSVYRTIIERVFPVLQTYPYLKVWHAGCATGEEVYSLAILLGENGLYERSTIYATDFNDMALEKSKEGIYNIEHIKQSTVNYQKSGGKSSFSEYYSARYESVMINKDLRKNITFANHNLVADGVFSEMQLVICRNVMIYFNKELQNRVLEVLTESLNPGGFLCIGTKESIAFSSVASQYNEIDASARIYQKKYSV
ncbi:MAG: protein-glutamate O-methyltransferase CheR [Ignavibacteriaceae bacterium]|nr:protein-glutamate O-methyltransferase CheR [Ignavibacteriaceae bacterium]NUM71244.1 protein-glutamate O-methyltransferase CheR [Ignavibacteriaceae bacterium]